jgi:hypothetical protein
LSGLWVHVVEEIVLATTCGRETGMKEDCQHFKGNGDMSDLTLFVFGFGGYYY